MTNDSTNYMAFVNNSSYVNTFEDGATQPDYDAKTFDHRNTIGVSFHDTVDVQLAETCSDLNKNSTELYLPNSTINVMIGPNSILALVDTGSVATLCHSDVLKLVPNCKIESCSGLPKFHSANGQTLKIEGRVELTIKVNGFLIAHEFLVVQDLVNEIILGMDFLETHDVHIHCKERTVSFNNLTTVPMLHPRDICQRTVSLISACTLTPRAEHLLPVRVPQQFVD